MSTKPRAVLFLGPPGSGKSTLFAKLQTSATIDTTFVAFGQFVRESADKDPVFKPIHDSHVQRGELVPDEPICDLFRTKIAALRAVPGNKDALLAVEGFPKTLSQLDCARDCLDIRAIVLLTVRDTNTLVSRMLERAGECSRLDDRSHAVVAKRVKCLEKELLNLLKAVSGEFPVFNINADQGIAEVFQQACGVLSLINATKGHLGGPQDLLLP